MPSLTRLARRTELAKLASPMVVGRYQLMGLPRPRAAGLLKSRSVWRRFRGCVRPGAGAAGSAEADLSGRFSPAPRTSPACCWAKPDGIHAESVSRAAATERSCLADCRLLRRAFPFCFNTRVPNKCMIHLHGLLGACGVPLFKTFEEALGTQFCRTAGPAFPLPAGIPYSECIRAADAFRSRGWRAWDEPAVNAG